jgi:membrane-bound lytic murein transglycosylase A
VTGHYQPEFRGSLNRTDEFPYPVYGRPDDLIAADLKRFGQALPHRTIWGRVNGRTFEPYYSRRERENMHLLPEGLALCWLRSPVEVLQLHIQGSGIIDLGDDRRLIHYAASNGRAYRSIGRMLIDENYIDPEEADWPNIEKWASENPREFQEILLRNPRYIFFKWEKTGPVGCYGQVLVPGTSAALDNSVYPPGIPGFLIIDWPRLKDYPAWLTADKGRSLLLFNHDTGDAIKGRFRIDLYCGTGENAGLLAGKLKNRARFIIVLSRQAGFIDSSRR